LNIKLKGLKLECQEKLEVQDERPEMAVDLIHETEEVGKI
jgi:hypothetical protein